MTKFRFQPLLDLRITQRDAVLGELAEAMEALQRLREQRQTIATTRQQMLSDRSISRIGTLRLDGLLSQGRYERQLTLEQNQLIAAETQIEAEIERRRAAVRVAETEVRRLELLREKDQVAVTARLAKAEQALMDDIAARTREVKPWQY